MYHTNPSHQISSSTFQTFGFLPLDTQTAQTLAIVYNSTHPISYILPTTYKQYLDRLLQQDNTIPPGTEIIFRLTNSNPRESCTKVYVRYNRDHFNTSDDLCPAGYPDAEDICFVSDDIQRKLKLTLGSSLLAIALQTQPPTGTFASLQPLEPAFVPYYYEVTSARVELFHVALQQTLENLCILSCGETLTVLLPDPFTFVSKDGNEETLYTQFTFQVTELSDLPEEIISVWSSIPASSRRVLEPYVFSQSRQRRFSSLIGGTPLKEIWISSTNLAIDFDIPKEWDELRPNPIPILPPPASLLPAVPQPGRIPHKDKKRKGTTTTGGEEGDDDDTDSDSDIKETLLPWKRMRIQPPTFQGSGIPLHSSSRSSSRCTVASIIEKGPRGQRGQRGQEDRVDQVDQEDQEDQDNEEDRVDQEDQDEEIKENETLTLDQQMARIRLERERAYKQKQKQQKQKQPPTSTTIGPVPTLSTMVSPVQHVQPDVKKGLPKSLPSSKTSSFHPFGGTGHTLL